MAEKLEVIVARIDENVKHIKKEIKCIKDDCDNKMKGHNGRFKDHEERIRDNEKFKQRGYGALGLIGAILTVIGGLVVKLMMG